MITLHQRTLLQNNLEKKRILYSSFFYKKISSFFSKQLKLIQVLIKAGSPESAFFVLVDNSKPELEKILKECYYYVYEDQGSVIDHELEKVFYLTAARICRGSKSLIAHGVKIEHVFSLVRVMKIVKTEINCAINTARHSNAIRSGLLHKQWVYSSLEEPSKRHKVSISASIPIGERFSNGMLFPGEVYGNVRDVINCSCCCIYF